MIRSSAAFAAILGGVLLTVHAAPAFAETQAQQEAEAQADAQEKAKRAADAKDAAAKAPPPAIPGAVSDGEAAPPSKNVAEMSPNDALFDAINRGDSAGARDAVSRGAQLEAHTVLGQTPIDAAIEANRNDITFMLMSLRGAVGSGGRPHVVPAASQGPAELPGGRHHRAAHITRVAAETAAAPAADPGRPIPAVGFNGF